MRDKPFWIEFDRQECWIDLSKVSCIQLLGTQPHRDGGTFATAHIHLPGAKPLELRMSSEQFDALLKAWGAES